MRSFWDLLFLHFFFARDILTLISASASASDSDSEEELLELEELSSDSDKEVSLSEEFESNCSSTLAVVGIFGRSPKSRDGRSCGNGTYDLSRKYRSIGRHVSATVWGSGAHDGIRGTLGDWLK